MTVPAVRQWRVKVWTPRVNWVSAGADEATALQLAKEFADAVEGCGDTTRLLPFLTKHGVTARIRGRDVLAVEPVGPRWEADEQPRRRTDDDHLPPPSTADLVAAATFGPPSPAVIAALNARRHR